jgi:hypothetical protein
MQTIAHVSHPQAVTTTADLFFCRCVFSEIGERTHLKLIEFGLKGTSLRAYNIGGCATDLICETLGQHCPRIKSLDISSTQHITDRGLLSIAKSFRTLEKLDIQVTLCILPSVYIPSVCILPSRPYNNFVCFLPSVYIPSSAVL